MPSEETIKKQEAAQKVIDVLQEMAGLLVRPRSENPLSLID